MRRILSMTAIAALLLLACGERGPQTDPRSETSEAKVRDTVQPAAESTQETPGNQELAAKNEGDPILKDYIYPGSELDGQFVTGNILSMQYMAGDDFADVTAYYQQKFPGTTVGPGTSVYFGRENPDGSDVTVTLTQIGSGTQIILKLTEKM